MAESLCCSPEIKSCFLFFFFFFLRSMHHKGAAAWEMKSCRASLLGSSTAETHRTVKSPEGSRWLQGCGAPHRALFPNRGALLAAWGELALICPLAVDGEFPPTGKSCLTQEVISKGNNPPSADGGLGTTAQSPRFKEGNPVLPFWPQSLPGPGQG